MRSQFARKSAQRSVRSVDVACLAEPGAKRAERLRRHAVARGCCVVMPGLRTVYQRLVIMAGEKEPTGSLVLEAIEQSIGQFDAPREILRPELCLQQLKQRPKHEGVVIEIGIQMCASVLVGCEKAPVAPESLADEVGGSLGGG